MDRIPDPLHRQLRQYGQEHLLTGWERLNAAERTGLVSQLSALDFDLLARLHRQSLQPETRAHDWNRIRPLDVEHHGTIPADSRRRGWDAIRKGEVAVLVVAGGLGSRLGRDVPKGLVPIGPISEATLFQIHAEKVLHLRQRTGAEIPFLVMTSPATHEATVAYFQEHKHFGLPASSVHFFQQGTMPAVDRATGRLLLERPGQLFLGPNGHGGTLTALADSGLLADLDHRGIRQIFYFQVDNPLVRIADPAFVGRHLESESQVSSKVIAKRDPHEKVGILADDDGRCRIIEYSDLPAELAAKRNDAGQLLFRAGSPAIHLFSLDFLKSMTGSSTRLDYHTAIKKVPHFDPATGNVITPAAENAVKFELFVFDALPLADRWLAVEVDRSEEFAPVKNATGHDSPETAREAILARDARWLAMAGWQPDHPVEIAPTYALDATDLQEKLPAETRFSGPTYLR